MSAITVSLKQFALCLQAILDYVREFAYSLDEMSDMAMIYVHYSPEDRTNTGEIIDALSDENCPKIAGKPKLFMNTVRNGELNTQLFN